MATLWDKGKPFDKKAEEFTVGKDRQLDLKLAKWDVTGSKAHVAMLGKIGLPLTRQKSSAMLLTRFWRASTRESSTWMMMWKTFILK